MSDEQERPKRKSPDLTGFQQITKLPAVGKQPIRPGDWIKLRDFTQGTGGERDLLSGKVRQVRSLVCAVTERDQERAVWRLVVEPEGRAVTADLVLRFAEPREIPRGRP